MADRHGPSRTVTDRHGQSRPRHTAILSPKGDNGGIISSIKDRAKDPTRQCAWEHYSWEDKPSEEQLVERPAQDPSALSGHSLAMSYKTTADLPRYFVIMFFPNKGITHSYFCILIRF